MAKIRNSKKKKLALTLCYSRNGWAIRKSLFATTNQNSTFSHSPENLNMFDITSKYFTFFNNRLPAS